MDFENEYMQGVTDEGETFLVVPIDAVHPHPRNNEFFSDIEGKEYQDLKDSIAAVGLLTPLRVSKDFTIISGHQRYRACKELGAEYIRVIVDSGLVDQNEMLAQLIVSNFGRIKNDPVKQGKMIQEYERLMGTMIRGGDRRSKDFSNGPGVRLKTECVASKFGITAHAAREYKRFANMSEDVHQLVKTGKLSVTAAVRFLGPLSQEEQETLLSSFPAGLTHITRSMIEEKTRELFQKNEEYEKKRQEEIKQEDIMREKQFERDRLMIEKKFADAERAQEEAKQAIARQEDAEQQLAAIQQEIANAERTLAQKQCELEDTKKMIAEAGETTRAETKQEIAYSPDYVRMKQMEHENKVMKEKLKVLEENQMKAIRQVQVAPVQSVEPDKTSRRIPTFDNIDERSMSYVNQIQSLLVELERPVNDCIADPTIFKGLKDKMLRNKLIERYTTVMTDFNKMIKNLEAK